MSKTDEWFKGIEEQGKSERERRRALMTHINSREADLVVQPPGAEHQYGYFRVKGGVIRLTRWGDDKNWLPETREQFTFEEIEALASFL